MRVPFLAQTAVLVAALGCVACSDSNMQKDGDGNYVVNTTELGKDIKGYVGQTPLNLTINPNGVIVKVEALQNSETPDFFRPVEEKLLKQLEGKNSSTIDAVDGVSGATFSSRAVLKNTKAALDYYHAHK